MIFFFYVVAAVVPFAGLGKAAKQCIELAGKRKTLMYGLLLIAAGAVMAHHGYTHFNPRMYPVAVAAVSAAARMILEVVRF